MRSFSSRSGASTCVGKLRKGKIPGLDPKEWEALGHHTANGSDLYLRFVGEAP